MSATKNNLSGSEFIVKNVSSSDIFTPEDFSEEQQMMKESVTEFIDRNIIPHHDRFENKDYALTEKSMEQAGELGFLGINIEEKYGGLGMSFTSTCLVCDYISGGNGSFSTAYGAHTGIGTMPIALYGTKEQKEKYLPGLVSGEYFGSYCLTEPTAGSDANSGKTKAVLSEDKTHYKITGQKMWISNAGFAKIFIVFARIEDDKNLTCFIVPRDENNGITFGEEEKKLGIRASSTRQVFFNETKVPVENMLAERQGGFKIDINVLNIGRIKLGAGQIDSQRRVTSLALQYAKERKQFNTEIIKFGAIQHKIATMVTNTFALESALYRAANDIDIKIQELEHQGLSKIDAELKAVENFAIECSILKVIGSEYGQHCSDEGIQIYGGMGFSEETPMEAAWRDGRISRIYEGTNEINRILAVGMILKKSLKGEIDLMAGVTQAMSRLMEKKTEDPDLTGLLAQESLLVKNMKDIFFLIVGSAYQKFGDKVANEQQVLLRIADVLNHMYVAESIVLRVQKNHDNNADKLELRTLIAQLSVYDSLQAIISSAKEVAVSVASGVELKQLLKGIDTLSRYSNYPNVSMLRSKISKLMEEETQYPF